VDEPVVILCPTCGQECTSEATFCGACGSALELPAAPEQAIIAPAVPTALAEPAPVEVTAPGTPVSAPATALPAATAAAGVSAEAAPASGATRRCNWCGTENAGDAQRCVKCGAMFPTPETDAAYMAAAEERIRGVQESLELMRRSWHRRGFGRLFDN
jgi:hypothetical protein